jgi:conjugative relaxase-like TrwC/TraI family protein
VITMTQIRDGQAYMRNHLSSNDYYSESETVTGHWHGKAAEMLGIAGDEVTAGVFEALRTNRHPQTGEKLTPRKPKVAYHDFVVSAPKSVSIVAMVGGDDRVVEAFDRCVEKAFKRLEAEACVRVRGGQAVHTENVRKTGNAVAAVYRHDTSRLLDPQLHSHLVFANVTWDQESDRWLALQPKGMGEQSQSIRQDFYRELASECRGLGYRTEPDGEAFRLKEVDRSLEKTFSQRAVQREHFEGRYEEVFGEKPEKKRVEQFIKDGKAAATRRFQEDYQARFSETPSQDLTQSFVRDWRSSKMSKAEPAQVKSIQQGLMTSSQAKELSRLVARTSNKAGPDQQSVSDETKRTRSNPVIRNQNRSNRNMTLGKKAMRIHAAMMANPTALMAIRLRQLARTKANESQRRTQ